MSINISASLLKEYLVCPYKAYYYTSRDLIEPIKTVPLILGSVVHEAIESIENQDLPKAAAPYWMDTELSRRLSEDNVVFTKYDSVAKTLRNAKEMLQSYLDNRKGDVLEVEKYFSIPMITSEGNEFNITGRIDLLVDINDKLSIVDLKTSRRKPTEFQIAGDYQFTLYYYVYTVLKDKDVDVYNFHLRSGTYINYPRNDSHIKELEQHLDKVANILTAYKDSMQNLDTHRGYHCNNCFYRELCYD